jgi:NTP pyrophosphatase (non-canonical NTP hydrolase)
MPLNSFHGDPEIADVLTFFNKFGHLANDVPVHVTKRKLKERLACLREEVQEFADAIETQDLPEQVDALIDLIYFAKGTALMLGVGEIWTKLWTEVQRANMTKEPGVTKRGHRFDCVKPMGWQAPQLLPILEKAGYDRDRFALDDHIIEDFCFDDEPEVNDEK